MCSCAQLINMCSSDGQRMFEAAAVGSLLAGGPLIAVLGMGYNLAILGPTSLLGSAVFILFYPAMVSRKSQQAHWSHLAFVMSTHGYTLSCPMFSNIIFTEQ